MKLDQFLKARIKITLLISIISTLILSAFSGSIYYFYKKQIILEISDQLKSIAFEIAKKVENPVVDFSIVKNMKIPPDTYVCIFNPQADVVFYRGKMCKIPYHFSGFRIFGNDVVYGVSFKKEAGTYHIYVGKNLKNILNHIDKLKFILFYLTFAISLIILVLSFLISKNIISPIKEVFEKQERFTQNVSHDLRTPLTVMSSNLYLIEQKKYQNIEKNIENIKKTVEYMKKLVSDLLFFSQIGEREKSKISLNKIIKDQLNLFAPKIIEKNIQVYIREDGNAEIFASERDMEMLISNLIENAIKYNYQNGEIWIWIKPKQIEIRNTGKLIKKENIKKIFERFYREEKSRTTEGSGLGLSIVKEIADHYKIKIKVDTDGKYNIFTLRW